MLLGIVFVPAIHGIASLPPWAKQETQPSNHDFAVAFELMYNTDALFKSSAILYIYLMLLFENIL